MAGKDSGRAGSGGAISRGAAGGWRRLERCCRGRSPLRPSKPAGGDLAVCCRGKETRARRAAWRPGLGAGGWRRAANGRRAEDAAKLEMEGGGGGDTWGWEEGVGRASAMGGPDGTMRESPSGGRARRSPWRRREGVRVCSPRPSCSIACANARLTCRMEMSDGDGVSDAGGRGAPRLREGGSDDAADANVTTICRPAPRLPQGAFSAGWWCRRGLPRCAFRAGGAATTVSVEVFPACQVRPRCRRT